MNSRLTDEQIDKSDTTLRNLVKGMKSGKVVINERDWGSNEYRAIPKKTVIVGTTTLRQFIRVINDLRYYKNRVIELEEQLHVLNRPDVVTRPKHDELLIGVLNEITKEE